MQAQVRDYVAEVASPFGWVQEGATVVSVPTVEVRFGPSAECCNTLRTLFFLYFICVFFNFLIGDNNSRKNSTPSKSVSTPILPELKMIPV